jgi:DNA-binding NarL/FixJ family response regulator
VVADDQELVRKGFRVLLDAEPNIEVVAEAADGREAVAQVARHHPAIVLMDIQMPGMDGLEATRQILDAPGNTTRVLILTTFERDDYIFDALRLGASGFLLKTSPPEELISAITVVARGAALLSPSVTRRVIARFARHAPALRPPETVAGLTDREHDVLRLLAQGMSNAEIGQTLFVSEATVKTHMSNLLAKLGLRDRVQAVIFAYEHGLADRD